MTKKIMSYPQAMKDFFGLRPGTNTKDFVEELKALTPEDKEEFRRLLPTVGYQLKA